MGRSPNFTSHDIIRLPVLATADVLSTLSVGCIIQLTVSDDTTNNSGDASSDPLQPPKLVRAVSTYSSDPLPLVSGTYTVISSDADGVTHGAGLRALLLKNNALDGYYFNSWMITTDGYIREVEACGIIGRVETVVVVGMAAEPLDGDQPTVNQSPIIFATID
jgi:hypothetical protein